MAHKHLIRSLAALSLVSMAITAVIAQETASYPFTEVERTADTSRIDYDPSLSNLPASEAGRELMCGSAALTLEREFEFFRAAPVRGRPSATLEFYTEPPRRSVVVSSLGSLSSQDLGQAVIDASWLTGVCNVRAETELTASLDPDELQEIRIRARQVPIDSNPEPPILEPEIICVREATLNSRIPTETCTTQRELDRLAEASREWMRSGGEWGGMMEVNTID